MGQIRDIMEKNVITIEEAKTALDASKILLEKDISFLVIIKNEIPVGVLSESDFVRKIAAQNKTASDVLVSDIMSHKYRSVEPSTEIEDAVQKMLNNNIRRLLVIENEKLPDLHGACSNWPNAFRLHNLVGLGSTNQCERHCRHQTRCLGYVCPCRDRQVYEELRRSGRFREILPHPNADSHRFAKGDPDEPGHHVQLWCIRPDHPSHHH